MIRLDVACLLSATAAGSFAFQTSVILRQGLLWPTARREVLGDFERPVLLAWCAGAMMLPQILGDVLGYVVCDLYSFMAILCLCSALILYTGACADVASQLSFALTAASTEGPAVSVRARRRLLYRVYRAVFWAFLVPSAAAMVTVSHLKECSDLPRHFFWGILELVFFGQCVVPVLLVTCWCYSMGRSLERSLRSSEAGNEKVGLARPILQAIRPCIIANALALAAMGLAAPAQMLLLGLAERNPEAADVYYTVQCVACATVVLLMQLAPAFFIHGVVRHCPNAGRRLKRFARQFDSSKLTTRITEGQSATDALKRGRELCCAVRLSQLGPDTFAPGGGLGVTPASLEKCACPDFFFSRAPRSTQTRARHGRRHSRARA